MPNRLLETLSQTRSQGRMALCGYFLVGYPTPVEFYRMARAARDLDVIEFGIPAANPSLDGPVIASAHGIVTEARGLDAETSLALIGGLRELRQPRFVMTYASVGRALDGFLRLCLHNEVHGLLAPDADWTEGTYIATIGRPLNMAIFTLCDARADDDTVRRAAELGDVVYLKAAAGQTGQSVDLAGELGAQIANTMQRLRALKPNLPIAVGIGLQHPEQLKALARLNVDMAVIGTKIVERLAAGESALVEYLHSLRAATYYPTERS